MGSEFFLGLTWGKRVNFRGKSGFLKSAIPKRVLLGKIILY